MTVTPFKADSHKYMRSHETQEFRSTFFECGLFIEVLLDNPVVFELHVGVHAKYN